MKTRRRHRLRPRHPGARVARDPEGPSVLDPGGSGHDRHRRPERRAFRLLRRPRRSEPNSSRACASRSAASAPRRRRAGEDETRGSATPRAAARASAPAWPRSSPPRCPAPRAPRRARAPPRRTPARGIGIIMTPAAAASRSSARIARPSACRRISSSSDIPVPNRSVREQSPPIERAAISMTATAPRRPRRSSAWTGPSAGPSARAAAGDRARDRACRPPGAGATASRRSSPRRTARRADPACRRARARGARRRSSRPSSATSRPGTKSSTRISVARRPAARARPSGSLRMPSIRPQAVTNSAASSARMTPRLPARNVGFRTHGYPTSSEAARGSSSAGKTRWRGRGDARPAQPAPQVGLVPGRDRRAPELCGSPSRSAIAAAATAVSSSTPTTASTGVAARKRRDPARARRGIREIEREQPLRVEPSSALGSSEADRDVEPEPRRRGEKIRGPVSRRRQKQQHARHRCILAAGPARR